MKDYDEDALLYQEDIVLFLCSTWTDGTPPEAAVRFVAWLDEFVHDFRVSKSHLANIQYAVFGLGSAIYDDNFCKVTRQVDQHFKELGARPLLYPMFGDDQTDLESKFVAWSNSAVEILKDIASAIPRSSSAASLQSTAETSKIVNKLNGIKSSVFKLQKKLENAKIKQQKANGTYIKDDNSVCCNSSDNNTNGCCNSNDNVAASACCSSSNNNEEDVEEEEEDRINSKYVTMDHYETDSDDGNGTNMNQRGHDDIIDMEDLGKEMSESKKQLLEDMKGER